MAEKLRSSESDAGEGDMRILVVEDHQDTRNVLIRAMSTSPSSLGSDHHLSKPCDCAYLRTILEDRARWEETVT